MASRRKSEVMQRDMAVGSALAWRPTRAQLLAAHGKENVPDVIAPGLKLLFCGINPGLYSGAVGHHFARPGNRFWPALHTGGFTPRLITAFAEKDLLAWGWGITNLVARATARADELSADELRMGAKKLRARIRRYRPGYCAIVGIGAFRTAFDQPDAVLGPQTMKIEDAPLWVLPNPSGLNAHYQPAELAELFGALRQAVESPPRI